MFLYDACEPLLIVFCWVQMVIVAMDWLVLHCLT